MRIVMNAYDDIVLQDLKGIDVPLILLKHNPGPDTWWNRVKYLLDWRG